MNYAGLIKAINSATSELQGQAAAAVNQALVIRNWMVGAYLVEFEQSGKDRATYGARLLETLAGNLEGKGIQGLGAIVLGRCRQLFLTYPQIGRRIPSPLGTELPLLQIPSPVETKLAKLDSSAEPTPLSAADVLRLSWSHLLELIRIEDPWKRGFYENELLKGHWSKRQLQRQIESLLYERTGLSTNKKKAIELARKQEPQESFIDLLRDPYILEFTNLSDLPVYSEEQLETALLDHLQRFLLELGRGFCFEARQFRMTEGRKHHRVDLVFYHRLLRCHVLIDLKIRSFQPPDAGQMNFYVNWFKANMMAKGDEPPVGILLCSDKDGAEVEYATAGMDQKLFVSRYLTALPSAQKLRAFLEADRDRIESLMPGPSIKKRAPKSSLKNRKP